MIILLCWAETILIHSLPQLCPSFRTWSINTRVSVHGDPGRQGSISIFTGLGPSPLLRPALSRN